MRVNAFIIFIVVIITGMGVRAQSVYHFKYYLPATDDSILYSAFFTLFDNGAGNVRIKYLSSGDKAINLIQLDLQEHDAGLDENSRSNDKIFYTLQNARLIAGNGNPDYSPPVFCFKKNSAGLYEPLGVAPSITDRDSAISPFSEVRLMGNKDLSEEFVLQYFAKEDDVYRNLFKIKTRDLTLLEKNIRLILLAVANTNEPEIGPSCFKDMNRTVETFKALTDYLGIKFSARTVSGADYNKKNVENEINSLSPSSNDIVVFYYSGHGFRKPKDSRRFPYIDLRPKPDDTYMVNSANLEDIYSSIQKKGARLNLIISDCCNTEVTASNAIGSPVPRKKSLNLNWSQSNCQALFLNPKPLSILATAADVGQRASSNNDFGGFFSYFFKSSLENHLSFFKKDVTWAQVLQDVKTQTVRKAEHTYCDKPYIPENICEQYPVWK